VVVLCFVLGFSCLCLCKEKHILAGKVLATMVCLDVFLNAKHAANMKFAGEQALKYITLVLGLRKIDLTNSLRAKFDELLAAPDEDKTHKKEKKDKKDKTHKKDKKDKKGKREQEVLKKSKENKKQKTK
jgi:hypothetical protein